MVVYILDILKVGTKENLRTKKITNNNTLNSRK
jgi:hypothetical protein